MKINAAQIFSIFKENTDNYNYNTEYKNYHNNRIEHIIGNRTFYINLLGDYIDLDSNSNIEENPKIGFLRTQVISNYFKEKGMVSQRIYLIIRNGRMPELSSSEVLLKEFENCVEFKMK
jgi:hypothetical protein